MIWDRLDWELALITTTLCSITNGEGLKVLLYPSIKHWNNPGDISLPWTGECHQIPPPSLRAASASKKKKKKKSNHHWLNICEHFTHTKLWHLARGWSELKLSNSWGDKRKSGTHLPFSFHLMNTRNKKIKP